MRGVILDISWRSARHKLQVNKIRYIVYTYDIVKI